jgi:6,7-dimethyl-8-ribityllumazine synthase
MGTKKKTKQKIRFALVVSRFNERINEGLALGAKKYLAEQGAPVAKDDIYYVPGAFEAPLLAATLARKKNYAGIICLGSVIKGDTAHFEFVSLGATLGIQEAMLATETPIAFGILTTYIEQQALDRAQDDTKNKGREAAAACFDLAKTLREL